MAKDPPTMEQRVKALGETRQAKRIEMAQYVKTTHYVNDMVDAATHKAAMRLVASSKVADLAARKRLQGIDLDPVEKAVTPRVTVDAGKGKGATAATTA